MLLEEAGIEFDVVADLELLPLPNVFECFCQFSFRLNIEDPALEASAWLEPQVQSMKSGGQLDSGL